MDKYLQRIAENHILRDLQQFPIVGIVGPRQVGKTTLVKLLMNKLDKKAYYLDLELQADITKLENAEIYFKS
ncbi:MAG: AAA family ATPase, partial [Thermodesulfovibrionia bacterium]|nr:AAA family ATPase [Thermodesulfovibrionia bacterium]